MNKGVDKVLKGTVYSSSEVAEMTGYAQSTVREKIRNALKDGKINEFYCMQIGRGYALTSTGIKKVFGKTATEYQLEKMQETKCCVCKIEYSKDELMEINEDIYICQDCHEGKRDEAEERKFQEWREERDS